MLFKYPETLICALLGVEARVGSKFEFKLNSGQMHMIMFKVNKNIHDLFSSFWVELIRKSINSLKLDSGNRCRKLTTP